MVVITLRVMPRASRARERPILIVHRAGAIDPLEQPAPEQVLQAADASDGDADPEQGRHQEGQHD
jgi:hypothetical protein